MKATAEGRPTVGRKPANVWVSVESVDCHQCVMPHSNAFSPNLRGPESARLRIETPYKAGPVRRVSPTSQKPQRSQRSLSTDLVKGELVQRKPMLLSGEICAAPGSKSSRRLKARNRSAQAELGSPEVSSGRSTTLPMPMETGRAKQ